MIKLWMIVPLALFLFAACGGPGEPTIAPVPTETPVPTDTPSPTQTPWIITEYIEVPIPYSDFDTFTPESCMVIMTDPTQLECPPSLDDPSLDTGVGKDEGDSQNEPSEVNPTPTITPVPVPTPVPTPRWRPASNPVGEATFPGFKASGPTFSGDTFTMSAVIDGQAIPTQIQIWQSLRLDDLGGRCPTEKPIALLSQSQSGGTTSMQWEYCQSAGQEPLIYADSVPWLTGVSWTYTPRPRRRTTTPYIADWSVSANLNQPLVNSLRYDSPVGYTVVVFAGDTLMAKVWVDY